VVSNDYTQLKISVSYNAPTGTNLPLRLELRDASGNTQTVAAGVFCVPQMTSCSATPRLGTSGVPVTITAGFTGTGWDPDERGLSHAVASIQSSAGGTVYTVTLTNQPATTGLFSGNWTVPSAADWSMTVKVYDTQGHTGAYSSTYTDGFSSQAYSGQADVLLFYDYASTYDYLAQVVAGSISNAGRTCFTWKQYYRGGVSAAVLSNQSSRILFHYAPYTPTLATDGALREALDEFLAAGGRVCLAGGMVAETMATYGDDPVAFMAARFGSGWVKNFYSYSGGTFTNIVGVAGDPVSSNLQFNLGYYSYYRDEIQAVGPGIECFRYNPASAVDGATLGGAGTAGVRTEGAARTVFLPWELSPSYLTAADRNRIVTNVLRYLEGGGPHLSAAAPGVQDGDADGYLEPGEQAWIRCRLDNDGLPATNAQATLATTSAWCSVAQGAWAPGTIATGASVSNTAAPFEVRVASNAPLGALLPLTLTVSACGGAYTRTFPLELQVARPALAVAGYIFNDSAGNGDGAPGPGERVFLVVALTNGGYRADAVVGALSCTNPLVTLVHSNVCFGTIEPGGCARNSSAPFCFDVSPEAPTPLACTFELGLSYRQGCETGQLTLACGTGFSPPTALASEWIDTSGGTPLSLGDEVTSGPIALGFSFLFFGAAYDSVRVNDNGFVIFGSGYTSMMYNNASIPNAALPNGFAAPFWDDLDTGYGAVRYCQVGAAPNRCWVVEWNNVQRYYSPSDTVTVQAVLSEDGAIRFQYGPLSGANSDGRSATIGIEGPAGTNGVLYACNRIGAVSNGLALVFLPAAGTGDADHDGISDDAERFYFGQTADQCGTNDVDGDGLCNSAELHCGTDPADSNSVLRLVSVLPDAALLSPVLRWQSIPGKPYRVYQSTNLPAGIWTNLTPAPLAGAAGGINAYTTAPAAMPAFWQVVVP
jgi:hypothetical protein